MAAALLFLVPVLPSQAWEEEAAGIPDYFHQVCGGSKRMDVSFVIDQSASLTRTDPEKGRLEAGERFIRDLGRPEHARSERQSVVTRVNRELGVRLNLDVDFRTG